MGGFTRCLRPQGHDGGKRCELSSHRPRADYTNSLVAYQMSDYFTSLCITYYDNLYYAY